MHSFYRSAQPSGESSVVEAEVGALRRAGLEVGLFSVATDDGTGGKVYEVRAAARVASGRGRSPVAEIRRFAPDVVHVHNLFPNYGRRWVERVDVPVVHTLHNYRPICAGTYLLRDGAVCTLCPDGDRWAGVRHRCYRGSVTATLPLAWANRRGPMADPLLRRADALIVLSPTQLEQYRRSGVPPAAMHLSPHFLPAHLDPGPAPAVDGSTWVVAGRLSPEKGITQLLEGWPRGVPLTVIGDGPDRPEVERLATGLDVTVTGQLPRAEVIERMRAAMGLVFPSLWFETFGLAYMEAIACDLPVLAFEPSTVATAVRAEGTGTVAERTPASMTAALKTLTRRRRTEAGQRRAVFDRVYSEASFAERRVALYRALAAGRAAGAAEPSTAQQ